MSDRRAAAETGILSRMVSTWTRRDWWHTIALLGVVALIHLVGFGLLLGVIGPHHYQLGSQVFGVGLGITAYTYGLRHAFDADHIAAIDNTTRKLVGDGKRPKSVGFWFAMGHSSLVFVLAALVGLGTHVAGALTDDSGSTHRTLRLLATLSSGTFLYLIGALNLVALAGIYRIFRRLRAGDFDPAELEATLDRRGLLARILARLTRTITRPGQMFGVGVLFGLGFDTASEVSLLVLAGTGAASGLPWYAILVLPVLFAAGMSLLDSLDGLFMNVAYDWAFANPIRKVYYNLSITGLSVAVAVLVGSIELASVLHENLGWQDPVTSWMSGISLNNVGFLVVGLFVVVWVTAVGYWRWAKLGEQAVVPAAD